MPLNVDIRKRLDHFELRTELCCPAGELTAIVGPSGSGKTTLIRLIAGLDKPDHGTVSLGRATWTDTTTGRFVPVHERKIGLVFQEFTLFPHLSVRKNIAFGAPDHDGLGELMQTFGIRHLENRKPNAISGGERQRAAFCQALARRPGLLLLDEPFSALDVSTRSFLCGLLAELKTDIGIPILHVTHDLTEAGRLGDAVVALDCGRINPGWLDDETLRHQPAATFLSPATP